ncbi:MAG: substrate-binding domain-containing protein [Streptococcaceae bacterium]|nr:substrate-binding domain-containing protein [Streptococcaceae bacterium]MCL2681100.1 substrate-binding domain-containing protein [Streptococcaceae bacterium]
MTQEQIATIYDVARTAEVSMATVSRVVNGNTNVKESTRQRVLDAIDQLNYRPNAIARGLASKRTTTIGVIIPTITNTYFSGIARGVDDIASMYQYDVIIANSDNDEDKELKIIESLLSKQVDGIIYLGKILSKKISKKLKEARVPVVLSGTLDHDNELASVNIDYKKAAYQTTVQLLKKNKRVAIVPSAMTELESKLRLEGYKQALKEAGIGFDKELVFEGNMTFEDGLALSKKMKKEKVQAAIVAYDVVAVGLLHGLLEQGITLPKDFEIVAGANSLLTLYCFPALTSVNQPLYDMGAIAMRMLTKLIHKEEVKENQIILEHEIVKRDSTK